MPHPGDGQSIRAWLADAVRWRLDHALRCADTPMGWRIAKHWPRSALDGRDTKETAEQWTYWYIEILRNLDRKCPGKKHWGKMVSTEVEV